MTTAATTAMPRTGDLLREWRRRRRMTQLDLALQAEVSQRHLSFVESGRATPSREMVLHLAEHLAIPLRQRNALLIAAGFAPVYRERALDDPALGAARRAVDLVLRGHEPFPALAVDRHWNLVAANACVAPLLAGVPEHLLAPPLNVLRVSLHPDGIAPRIVNYAQVRHHLLSRLARQIDASGDAVLTALLDELKAYRAPTGTGKSATTPTPDLGGVAVPLMLRTEHGVLSLVTTVTMFGTPVDITLSELAIETFFPADEATAATLRAIAAADC